MPWTPDPAAGSGGGGAGPLLGFSTEDAAPKSGGPFINWRSPLSILTAAPRAFDAAVGAEGSLIEGAGRGLLNLPVQAGKEVWNDAKTAPLIQAIEGHGFHPGVPDNPQLLGAANPQEALSAIGQQQPLTGGLIQGNVRTAQDLEQLTRAGVNTIPRATGGWTPAGASVGALGTGAGGLGTTDLAKAAARGGGGVAAPLLNDAVNVATLADPAAELVKGAAEEAAATAASHGEALSAAQDAEKAATKAASQNVQQAASQAREALQQLNDARAAATTGDPTAAASFQAAQQAATSASEALRQAQEAQRLATQTHGGNVANAQQLVDEAQAHADQLKGHAATIKRVASLGSKAAGSPFAPLTGVDLGEHSIPGVLGLAGKAAHAVIGSDLGERYLQPVIDRAQAATAAMGERSQMRHEVGAQREQAQIEKANVGAELQRGFTATAEPLPNAEQPVKRGPLGLFGTKTVPVIDPEAHAVATMAQTEEGAHLRNLLGHVGEELPGGSTFTKEQALQIFEQSNPNKYSPETLELASQVFGHDPVEGRAAAIRDAIPAVKEAYAKPGGALDVQNEQYRRLAGEAGVGAVRPEPGAGAFGQAEHNLTGDTPNIEHLSQNADLEAAHARDRAKGERALATAAKKVVRANERLDAMGISAAERADPTALVRRVSAVATEGARAYLDKNGPQGWQALAEATEPGVAKLAQRVLDGKLAPDLAVTNLADKIIGAANKKAERLSPPMQALMEEARGVGLPDITPRIGSIGPATTPAINVGRGVERAKIGAAQVERGTGALDRADTLYGKAMDKLGLPTRNRSAAIAGAQNRLVAAATKLAGLRTKLTEAAGTAGEAEKADLFAHAGVDKREVVATVRDVRKQLKGDFKAQAESLHEELSRMDATALKWPPDREMKRVVVGQGEQKGQMVNRLARVADSSGEDLRTIAESGMTHDARFFRPDGKSIEELVQSWTSAHGEAGGAVGLDQSAIVENWLNVVGTIRDLEKAARVGVERGWDPLQFGTPRAEIEQLLTGEWGPEIAKELAPRVVFGDPKAIVGDIAGRLAEHVGETHIAETQAARQAAVASALENDRANEEQAGKVGTRAGRATLDPIGKALYDRQVAEDQTGVQGQIVGQRTAQTQRSVEASGEATRTQGRTEGALLGRAQEVTRGAEAQIAQGAQREESGAAITATAPERQAATAARISGPVGRMYLEAGKRVQKLADATASYDKEQRALDRLDEGLAAKQKKLEQSVEAAPRPMRPVLEQGERIRKVVTPIADAADAEFGPGAGDVWRNVAAEATILSADTMKRFGVDPQFLIGEREGRLGPINVNEPHTGGPVVGATGQRKAGIGLKHATDYKTLYESARRRAYQAIDNETGQRIITGRGGTLADMLEAQGMPRDQIQALSGPELAKAMKDADLAAWNLSDRRGGLIPQSQLALDSKVVPTGVWKAWSRYTETPGPEGAGGLFLKGYDKTTQFLKHLSRLSPRWQVSLLAGHAVMAMVGGGFDPISYFSHLVPDALHLDRMARTGEITAEDAAWIKTLDPKVQAALSEHGGFVPGAVRNRGFVREEFPGSEASRAKVGDRGMKLQTSLDNMHRTAVWIGSLEKGLDAEGLRDFRTAYPDLAHLSDTQIKNEAAIRLSIRTMGDYLNKTPFERQTMSRIVYFYPWLKHITKLTLNTAIHNPLRTAWLLHLGAMFDPGQGPVDFLRNSYDIGNNRWITPPSWNPFEAVIPTADNPFGSLNPIAETAVAGATGFNLGTGKPVTRPAGASGPLGLNQLINFGLNESPVIAAARTSVPSLLGGGKPLVRYQTGEPYLGEGHGIPANEDQYPGTNTQLPDWLAPWAGLTGLPRQRQIDANQIVDRQAAATARDAKAKAKYEKRRKLIGAG